MVSNENKMYLTLTAFLCLSNSWSHPRIPQNHTNYEYFALCLTLTASDIFVVFRIKIKYFLILQAINKKIFVKCVIFSNPRTPPGGVKPL